MNNRKTQPAFPAFPAADNFGKIFTPFPGLSQYEYVLLQFVKEFAHNYDIDEESKEMMVNAEKYTRAFFNHIDSEKDKDETSPVIKLS